MMKTAAGDQRQSRQWGRACRCRKFCCLGLRQVLVDRLLHETFSASGTVESFNIVTDHELEQSMSH